MPAFDIKSITGVIPAVVTTFDANDAFDEARMRAVIRFLIACKVDGLYLTGSTGESFLMAPEERKRVVEVVVSADGAPLLVGQRVLVKFMKPGQKAGVKRDKPAAPVAGGMTKKKA